MNSETTSLRYHDLVSTIEKDMQNAWHAERIDRTDFDGSDDQARRYVLGMFPYPSGNAHLGHILVYSLSDSLARLGRYKGEAVVHPLGWDAFGLPAENAAIQNNRHPAEWTRANIRRMRDDQISRAGFSFDLDLEIDTSSPEYYHWTQWLFLKLYEHGQVYRTNAWVNWDPIDKTVLANEQVIDGCGWRSGAPIERRLMEQWSIRITDFAEDLWRGLDSLPGWSERAIAAQRNWIGRSEGADVVFKVEGGDQQITTFTTRADTLFGVTSLTLAPEHPLLAELVATDVRDIVSDYVEEALKKSEVDRQADDTRTGVAIGRNALHPLTGAAVPIYVSDYVIGSYGTGAIMNVPAHDARDFDFAQATGLPIRQVVTPVAGAAEGSPIQLFEDDGVLVDSGTYSGLASRNARTQITEDLQARGLGRSVIRYRLRDWTISRQRFWGAPIPMLQDRDGRWEPVPESDLPVRLPDEIDFEAAPGHSQLRIDPSVLETRSPSSGEPATREADTMDTFMCSAWYAWRFLDPKNIDAAWRPSRSRQWMPIDFYVGGLEHANQHLIYFRYMSHFLHSIGLTPTREPVTRFLDNGMVRLGGHKMSKSRGNTVTPDGMIDRYGADALRMYILSDAPFERDRDWDEAGLEAKQRFLARVFTLVLSLPADRTVLDQPPQVDGAALKLVTELRNAMRGVESQLDERRSFHTAIATVHSTFNSLSEAARNSSGIDRSALAYSTQQFLKMLSLFAPHLTDWLWRERFGKGTSIFAERWPESVTGESEEIADMTTVAVQVGGRRRGELVVATNADDAQLEVALAEAIDPAIRAQIDNRRIERIIVVREASGVPKLLNVVLAKTD